jgi:hypothetical protein
MIIILSGSPVAIEFFFILGMEKLYFLRLAIEKKFTGKFKQIIIPRADLGLFESF